MQATSAAGRRADANRLPLSENAPWAAHPPATAKAIRSMQSAPVRAEA